MNVTKEGFPHHQGIPNITHSSQLNPQHVEKKRHSNFLVPLPKDSLAPRIKRGTYLLPSI